MRLKFLFGTVIIALSPVLVSVVHLGPNSASATQARPNLAAIFGDHCRCVQIADRFGTVRRSAFDKAGRRIGTQVGTYEPDAPNKMRIEETYLEPDAGHLHGQAFDGAGNPTPL
jgi:hypothetical protein